MFFVHTTPEEFEIGGFTLKMGRMFFVHTTSEEFETEAFTLKMRQMFSVHTTPGELKNASITGHVGFVFEGNTFLRGHRFQKVPFPTEMSSVHTKTGTQRFQIPLV